MGTWADRTDRVLEDVIFRLCVGVGVFIGATVIARYLLTPDRPASSRPRPASRQTDWLNIN